LNPRFPKMHCLIKEAEGEGPRHLILMEDLSPATTIPHSVGLHGHRLLRVIDCLCELQAFYLNSRRLNELNEVVKLANNE
jgi:hypothetical protein